MMPLNIWSMRTRQILCRQIDSHVLYGKTLIMDFFLFLNAISYNMWKIILLILWGCPPNIMRNQVIQGMPENQDFKMDDRKMVDPDYLHDIRVKPESCWIIESHNSSSWSNPTHETHANNLCKSTKNCLCSKSVSGKDEWWNNKAKKGRT